ncbi:hypothetical protein [Actinokineospora fastidiosa]|uniref:Secreted protein n=1 Tax=Actinokineospora fastidiosa TaxID=1816 RepID=A0A918GJR2_9PSEU|nr:hypothetical protein [Actinokineospora fastidiosa]GGS42549.1 hypothetical protein GCM10010171_41850 [Actinokineospora fastidiosa]
MNRHLGRIAAAVMAVGVMSTAATGLAIATTPVVAESEPRTVESDLTALHERIATAVTAGDSFALIEAVTDLPPAIAAAYEVARSERAFGLLDEADALAAQIRDSWPWDPYRPPTAVATLVNSLLSVIEAYLQEMGEPVVVHHPVPVWEPVPMWGPVPLWGPVPVWGPDPVVGEPAAEAPVIEDPVVEEPAIEDPVIEEPVIDQPEVSGPVIGDAVSTPAAP